MTYTALPSSRQAPARVALVLTLGLSGFLPALAQSPQGDPKATEQWEPVPSVVSPGAVAGAPPSDAVILFDGRNLDQWVSTKDHSPAHWKVDHGVMTVDKALGNIETKQLFKNYQLHLEWRIPKDITGEGQLRGNSGLFLASTGPGDAGYEVQILDSWKNQTYVNGQAASIYKQAPPLVNAMREPGAWQTYDVVWTAPAFEPDGTLKSPAFATVFHNGVLVQNHVPLLGETVYIGNPAYRPYQRAAIKLQAHGDPSAPISFRNIWLREIAGAM
ncbi:MAG TPA: DUF1080 domain-containing protein [Steroidobacteraceae bacterium]